MKFKKSKGMANFWENAFKKGPAPELLPWRIKKRK